MREKQARPSRQPAGAGANGTQLRVRSRSQERASSVCQCTSPQIDNFPYKFRQCGGQRQQSVDGSGGVNVGRELALKAADFRTKIGKATAVLIRSRQGGLFHYAETPPPARLPSVLTTALSTALRLWSVCTLTILLSFSTIGRQASNRASSTDQYVLIFFCGRQPL